MARHGSVVFEQAFGNRAIQPNLEPMTTDTIFDTASLTKPVATASAVLRLAETGKLRLQDPVAEYLPEWGRQGEGHFARSEARVRHLLTHTAGLDPFERYYLRWTADEAPERILRDIATRPLCAPPGKQFIYSDLGFIALGHLVERVTGESLAEYCRREIFAPLAMHDTMFTPPPALWPRIAPTEWRSAEEGEGGTAQEEIKNPDSRTMTRGKVHDGNAAVLDGVSGHAGLFSTARDLARFCQMLLDGGRCGTVHIFSPLTIQAATTDQARLCSGEKRGYGWDIETPFSIQRGDLFTTGFGHTGWTGCSIWIVPEEDLFILLMTNRVHPDGSGDANRVRAAVANVVAGSLM